MAASPDGSVVYVINIADGTVTAIDTVTNREITTFVYDTTPVDLTDPNAAGPRPAGHESELEAALHHRGLHRPHRR
jgi:YVTN family beta-propeller protein